MGFQRARAADRLAMASKAQPTNEAVGTAVVPTRMELIVEKVKVEGFVWFRESERCRAERGGAVTLQRKQSWADDIQWAPARV